MHIYYILYNNRHNSEYTSDLIYNCNATILLQLDFSIISYFQAASDWASHSQHYLVDLNKINFTYKPNFTGLASKNNTGLK